MAELPLPLVRVGKFRNSNTNAPPSPSKVVILTPYLSSALAQPWSMRSRGNSRLGICLRGPALHRALRQTGKVRELLGHFGRWDALGRLHLVDADLIPTSERGGLFVVPKGVA